jgi:hypothetical protein
MTTPNTAKRTTAAITTSTNGVELSVEENRSGGKGFFEFVFFIIFLILMA